MNLGNKRHGHIESDFFARADGEFIFAADQGEGQDPVGYDLCFRLWFAVWPGQGLPPVEHVAAPRAVSLPRTS